MKTQKIHPSDLNVGDTVLIEGEMLTIGKETIKTGFFGTLVNGIKTDSIDQVLFPKWYKGEITGYYPTI